MTDAVHVSSKGKQDYITPMSFLRLCELRFGVDLVFDLAANAQNCRRAAFYDEAMDSLSCPWDIDIGGGKNCGWLNPPFGNCGKFMERCASFSDTKIITLTLSSLGTSWYKKHVKPNALSLILEERLTFEGQPTPYPKELMVSLWGFGMTGLGWWSWKT